MLDAFHHFFVGDDLLEALRRQLLEEHHGVFTGSTPKLHIEVVEDCLGFAVPNPPKIFGNLFKRLEFRGEVGFHGNVTPDGDISVADLEFHVVRWCIVLCDCFYIDECNLSLRVTCCQTSRQPWSCSSRRLSAAASAIRKAST